MHISNAHHRASMHAQALAVAGLLVAFLLAGCHEIGVEPGEDAVMTEVDVRDLDLGQHSGHEQEDRRLITSQSDWESFWQQHRDPMTEEEEAPAVDFDQERIIAVLMGQRPNGCYAIMVSEVLRDEAAQRTVANVTSVVPSPEAMCPQVIVHPFHFIAVPDDGTDVVFVEHEQEAGPRE
jgi:hypothetical protein